MSKPIDILQSLHRDIQNHTGHSGRRSWEALVTIMAHESGVNSLFNGTIEEGDEFAPVHSHLQEHGLDERLKEYFFALDQQIQNAKDQDGPVRDPLGEVLEQSEGTNSNMGQFFTSPVVVHAITMITLQNVDGDEKRTHRGLDPCCGTGRFAMDALAHHDNLIMFNVELDRWLTRAALVNFRYMGRFTTLYKKDPAEIEAFDEESKWHLRESGIYVKEPPKKENIVVLGGRAWIINADSLIVDLLEPLNWQWSWMWSPPPWEKVMKVSGFDGTYEEFLKAQPKEARSRREKAPPQTRYDFSLDETTIHPASPLGRQRMET